MNLVATSKINTPVNSEFPLACHCNGSGVTNAFFGGGVKLVVIAASALVYALVINVGILQGNIYLSTRVKT